MFNLFILTFLTIRCVSGNQNYVIQIAASKSPLNITELTGPTAIADNIMELKGTDWYRYYIGDFKTYKEALLYAKDLTANTKITTFFIRVRENISGFQKVEKDVADSNVQTYDFLEIQKANVNEQIVNTKDLSTEEVVKTLQDTLSKDSNQHPAIDSENDPFSGIKAIEKNLSKYIPPFVTQIFNSYKGEQYGYRMILFFFLILFLFILNIAFIIFIFIYSNKRLNYDDRYNSVYKTMYETVLLSFLMGENDWEHTLKKLKNHHLPQNRELLSTILLNFYENLKGGVEELMPETFVKLGLHNDALKQANSKFYYDIVRGIRKLSFLHPELAMKRIPELLNDDDDIVRAEAQTNYVRLNPDDPFNFLQSLTKPFTRWTQISAFYLFNLHRRTIPEFANYLDSTNTNVRNFSLRMITHFQQLENIPEILKMIYSEVESTRFLAIKAINDLRLYDGKTHLKEIYQNETLKNKVEIVKAFGNIGNNEDFDFLKSIIMSDNVSLKLEACRSLFYMGTEGKEELNKLDIEMDRELKVFIEHISDPRN